MTEHLVGALVNVAFEVTGTAGGFARRVVPEEDGMQFRFITFTNVKTIFGILFRRPAPVVGP